MAMLADRYDVSIGQLKAWNRTKRDMVMPGQVVVLHVPVGKAMPSEPGPQKLATVPVGAGVEKASAQVADTRSESRYDKKRGRGHTGVVKVSEPVKASKGKVTKVSTEAAGKASKADAGSRHKVSANAKKGK
jgi:membrane-bound lytic murein transglycosylase D